LAIGIITVLFALVSFAMVTGMGSSKVADYVVANSGDPVLSNPALVLFNLADKYVGTWMSQVMSWLVVSSLFAGLLAFQNAASRYFFAMGRGGVLPAAFGKVNGRGAPQAGAILTSVIAAIVIAIFAIAGLDPVLNLFFWMSGVTAIAIILVEILVSIAVVVYFMKNSGANVWQGKVAPIVAAVGLALGEYLLMSRFNLLAGTVADGVDPSLPGSSWLLSPLGWVLVLAPFVAMIAGFVVSVFQKNQNDQMAKDILS
jgi:amino acid transporter